jgi:hypothetical protein
MLEKIKKLWKAGGVALTFLFAISSAPTKIVLLKPLYMFFAEHWPSIWFRVGCAFLVSAIIYVFEIVAFFKPTVNVSLMPSGGGSADIVLRVKNDGKQGNFRATYEIVGSRETCGYPMDRTAVLKWEGVGTPQVNIAGNDSASLLIASHEFVEHNIAWLRLWRLDGQDAKQLASAGWERKPSEKLPEFDLKISVFRDDAVKPLVKCFTVRPESYIGPLEMFVTE